MPKPEWGVKRTCPTTGQRFYDLNQNPIISPYTGEVVELSAKPKTVDVAADLARATAATAAKEESLVDDEDVEETDATEEDALLDDDDDGDDDDASPTLSDEEGEDAPVEFDDRVLIDEDDDDENPMGDIGDMGSKDDQES
ncbi:MAG: TIGR02300 family protein [Pseudomonadota bacterium]